MLIASQGNANNRSGRASEESWPARILHSLVAILLLAFLFSVKTKVLALVAAVVAVVVVARYRSVPLAFCDESFAARLARLVPWLFPVLVFVHLLSKVFTGRHAVDFAIFSQSIDNVSRIGTPLTTLVGLEPVNFLTHHFAPVLYLVGAPGYFGIPGYILGITFQTISLALAIYAIYAIATESGLVPNHAAYLAALFCIHPVVRKGVTWSIHDELFGLGFLGMALLFWSRRQGWLSGLMLLVAMLCKETLLLCCMALTLAAIVDCRRKESERSGTPYVVILLLGAFLLVGYVYLRMNHLGSTFDPRARIASVEGLLDISTGLEKLKYLFFLFVPTLGLCLTSFRGCVLLLCAAPFWGASLISSFPPMYEPTNYYAVMPTYFIHIGCVFALAGKTSGRKPVPLAFASLVVVMYFVVGGNVRPLKEVRRAIFEPVGSPYSLSFVASGQRVIASEFDALFLPRDVTPLRLWTGNRLPTEYDSLLIRKQPIDPEAPAERLLKETSVCYEDETWILRCHE